MDNGTVYGECRCCLAKGKHRELMTEYYFNGVREVYYDIFGDCYNLFLSKNPKLTSLICDHCISRLRDAFSFRMMVASTERRLLILASNSQNKQKQTPVFVDVPSDNPFGDLEIKAESLATCKYEPEESDDSNDLEYVVADYDVGVYPEDSPTPSPQTSNLVEGEAELLARYPNVKRLPRIGELHSICPTFMAQLNNLNGIPVTSSMLLETEYVKKGGIISEKLAYIHNVTTLLQCSNITPFKSKNRSGYPCFYCKVLFEDFTKLRQHCLEHKSIDIIKSLRQFGPENLLVYADVLDLKCTLCYENVPKLQDLKTHLSKIHNKKFFDDFGDRIIPFKIIGNMYECQICTCLYETFGSLERHMNGHYRNYVCEECGSGFATKCRLKVHVKSMHALGHYPCEICKKTFTTQQRFKNHINSVHKMVKRFKCSKCPERFSEYFKRQKHLVEVHGVEPLRYKCNVCDKSFDRRYTLSRHLKRDHLEERDFECEICGYRSFTKNELKVHMVKHNGERIHNCTVCRKAYARKKTLREHMRIHNNDRRFVCSVCGQAFVQKCSLKGHLKTHHLEFNLQS